MDAKLYTDKCFVYYSLDNDTILDREPLKTDWELLFTKYYDYTVPRNVSGILINEDEDHVLAQEVRESGMDQATHNTYEESAFTTNISEIGYDWKKYDMGAGEWTLHDTVVYYLKTYGGVRDSSYYKIYFTDFTGMSEGKYTFIQERITFVSAEDEKDPGHLLQVYPNPASDQIQVVFDLVGRADIDIIDLTGRLIRSTSYEASGFTSLSMDITELNPGVFFVRINSGGSSEVLRFIKE